MDNEESIAYSGYELWHKPSANMIADKDTIEEMLEIINQIPEDQLDEYDLSHTYVVATTREQFEKLMNAYRLAESGGW